MEYTQLRVGIYCVSSQSGRAFFADMLSAGYEVYGYVRNSAHGEEFLQAVLEQGGLKFERPANENGEISHLIPVTEEQIGHDLHKLIWESDLIIVAEPSHYLMDTVALMQQEGLAQAGTPLVLAPPRTFAVPYLWQTLGTRHPFICFSTNPYSCKAPSVATTYIKRRKRCLVASLEGNFTQKSIDIVDQVFPQAVVTRVPAATSIGNIGAIFHPSPYVLKYTEICKAQEEGRPYSYYMEAISGDAKVAEQLEKIDQVRLQIADRLGLATFGLKGNEREAEWKSLMDRLRETEKGTEDIRQLRRIRSQTLEQLADTITSTQHWLDYTYGVERIAGEGLGDAVSRTPTYQKMSVPQRRYLEEDVPSSLLPMMRIAEKLGIDATPLREVMDVYYAQFGTEKKGFWRDLEGFSDDFVVRYLKGEFFSVEG